MTFRRLRIRMISVGSLLRLMLLRWVYGDQLEIGESVSAKKRLTINISTATAHVAIGERTFFNVGCSLNCRHSISIGKNCLFGENVHVYDHDHVFSSVDKSIADQGFSCKPVVIGNGCWLGTGVIVLKGVSIGDNCIVGAGTVVAKDIPKNTIVIAKQSLLTKQRDCD